MLCLKGLLLKSYVISLKPMQVKLCLSISGQRFVVPCRSGIEHTAGLRQQYKDHPDFQFIYITSDRESPEKTYNEYVERI